MTATKQTIREAYKAIKNTHGTVAHVLEYKEPGEAEFTPICNIGDVVIGYYACADSYTGRRRAHAYLTGKAAATALKDNKSYFDYRAGTSYRIGRYQVSQELADEALANDTWKAREAARFADGTYTPLPWANEAWFKDKNDLYGHFAHVSTEEPGMIAYTVDNTNGRANRKTRVKPGKFLRDYYYDLQYQPRVETGAVNVHGIKTTVCALEHAARTFTLTYGTPEKLCFDSTPEGITNIYKRGPESCMSHKDSNYKCEGHPTRIYGAGDLSIAWTEDHKGHITARALVWPDKKLTGRIYGDFTSLQAALTDEGYAESDNYALEGARLLKIADGNGYVMPYLDGRCTYHQGADQAYFILGRDPLNKARSMEAGYTHGLSYDVENEDEDEDEDGYQYDYTCEHCDEGPNETYTVLVPSRRNGTHEQIWCESCMSNHTFECTESGDTYANTVPHVTIVSGDTVASCNLDNYFCCAIDGEYYHNDDSAGSYEDEDTVADCNTDALVMDHSTSIWWRAEKLPADATNADGELYQQLADETNDTDETLEAQAAA